MWKQTKTTFPKIALGLQAYLEKHWYFWMSRTISPTWNNVWLSLDLRNIISGILQHIPATIVCYSGVVLSLEPLAVSFECSVALRRFRFWLLKSRQRERTANQAKLNLLVWNLVSAWFGFTFYSSHGSQFVWISCISELWSSRSIEYIPRKKGTEIYLPVKPSSSICLEHQRLTIRSLRVFLIRKRSWDGWRISNNRRSSYSRVTSGGSRGFSRRILF